MNARGKANRRVPLAGARRGSPEGAADALAQGNALGSSAGYALSSVGPTGQRISRQSVGPLARQNPVALAPIPQGVALGWEIAWAFGPESPAAA